MDARAESPGPRSADLSTKRVVGFACNQAFIFCVFYMGMNRGWPLGSFTVERIDLLCILLFMVLGFLLVRFHSRTSRQTLLTKPLLFVYAIVMAGASLVFPQLPDLSDGWMAVEGALIGFSAAFMLTAWGRAFGEAPTYTATCEVLVGSLVAAFLCLACSFISVVNVAPALCFLPVASAALVTVPASTGEPRRPASGASGDAAILSVKVLVGTLCMGASVGFIEAFSSEPGAQAIPYYPVSMLLFGAFLIGVLSLLTSGALRDVRALDLSYRIAVFLMLLGLIVIPLASASDLPTGGDALVLAGYLGLQAVFIALFLVLAKINAIDAAVSFSLGFLALYAGEFLGVLLANVFDAAQVDFRTPYTVVVIAGALILVAYIFLFTERDFSNLTEIVTDADAFELACEKIRADYGLSKREGEILGFALRGRTSERIAGELSITKSTVDTHLRRIYAKAGVHSRQELIDLGEKLRNK
jgi:DNA-binding CsgD family transcriptional regulator